MAQDQLIETKLQSSKPLIQSYGEFFRIRHGDLVYDYEDEPLAKGGSAAVFRGKWNSETVAIKKYFTHEEIEKEICNEAAVMVLASTYSKHLVQFKGISLEKPHYCLVMEYMPGGNLYDLLHSRQNISWDTRYRIGLDISIGLRDLHNKDILHCDLKSPNVLLNSNGRAKLADFGSAKFKTSSAAIPEEDFQGSDFQGSILWAAPEILQRNPSTKKSDVYSAGMILWELASRKAPYKEVTGMLVDLIIGGKKETFPPDTPAGFKTIVQECWQAPEKRPEAELLVKQLDQLWQVVQESEVKEKTAQPSISPNSSTGKKLNDGSQFVSTRPTDIKTPKEPEKKESTHLMPQSSLETQQTLVTIPSSISTPPSLHASQSAFFGSSCSSTTSLSEVNQTAPLGEKNRQDLMPLQNELITACENGSSAKVIDRGA